MHQSSYLYGVNELNNSTYFLTWGYQTGFVLYQTLIFKIFNNEFILHILDCIYGAISCVLVYLISNKLFKNKIASLVSSFLYTIGFFCSAYCGVLTNQHLFTLLILISIYFAISKEISYKKSLILGVILAFSNIIRPEAIIYLISIEIFLLLNITEKKEIKKYLVKMIIILLTYFITIQSLSFIIKKTNLNAGGLSNNDFLWKFVCGFDYNSRGQYSLEGEKFIGNKEKELEFIKNNLKMPLHNYIELFSDKIKTFWLYNDYEWVVQNSDINILNKSITKSNLVNIISNYDKILYLITLSFLFIYIIKVNIDKKIEKEEALLMIMIILSFLVYLLIEVQSRYSFTIKTCIYILSAGGISYVISILKSINKRNRKD